MEKTTWGTGCQLSNNEEKEFLDKLWPRLHSILWVLGTGY